MSACYASTPELCLPACVTGELIVTFGSWCRGVVSLVMNGDPEGSEVYNAVRGDRMSRDRSFIIESSALIEVVHSST